MPRILITAPASGAGKTLASLAILEGLQSLAYACHSFKQGSDRIDASYHEAITGRSCANLDLFIQGEDAVLQALAQAGPSLIEGAMGYYDGIGPKALSSSHRLACLSATPSLFVVDVSRMQQSAGALLSGFLHYKKTQQIRGVLLNRLSPKRYPAMKAMVEDLGLKALGYLPQDKALSLPEGSHGLAACTRTAMKSFRSALKSHAESSLDLAGIQALMERAEPLPFKAARPWPKARCPLRLAVAHDAAFSLLDTNAMAAFEKAGVSLLYFSPLEATRLPSDIDALYFPAGRLEAYLPKLAGQKELHHWIRRAHEEGLPILAEGEGFLYLHRQLAGHEMLGIIAAEGHYVERLQGFGYLHSRATCDHLGAKKGRVLRSSHFHAAKSSSPGKAMELTQVATGDVSLGGHGNAKLWAGFPRMYLGSHPDSMARVLKAMARYREERMQHEKT